VKLNRLHIYVSSVCCTCTHYVFLALNKHITSGLAQDHPPRPRPRPRPDRPRPRPRPRPGRPRPRPRPRPAGSRPSPRPRPQKSGLDRSRDQDQVSRPTSLLFTDWMAFLTPCEYRQDIMSISINLRNSFIYVLLLLMQQAVDHSSPAINHQSSSLNSPSFHTYRVHQKLTLRFLADKSSVV